MVAAQYRPVYRLRRFDFLDLKSVDGRWRINECFLVRPPLMRGMGWDRFAGYLGNLKRLTV